jgi:hypothetical protein
MLSVKGGAVSKPTRINLTRAQVRALENLDTGKASYAGLYGQSAMGGHHATMLSLRRKLFVDDENEITATGRAALKAWHDR